MIGDKLIGRANWKTQEEPYTKSPELRRRGKGLEALIFLLHMKIAKDPHGGSQIFNFSSRECSILNFASPAHTQYTDICANKTSAGIN